MSRYEEIENFVKVVNAGSITAAANQMRIAKSAVSRRLKDLETRLGVQLITRSTRKLSLTDTGQALFTRSQLLLNEWQELETAASQSGTDITGNLRLSMPLSFGLSYLSPVLLAFQQRHPNLKIDVIFTDNKVDLVSEGFDLAIRIGNLADSALIARKFAQTHEIVVASPAFLQQYGTPKTPDDLKGLPECCYRNRQHTNWQYQSLPNEQAGAGEKREIELIPAVIANNGDFLLEAAKAGLGILKIPHFFVKNAVQQGELMPVLTQYTWNELGVYAVYPYTRHLSLKVRKFVDYLIETFQQNPI